MKQTDYVIMLKLNAVSDAVVVHAQLKTLTNEIYIVNI